MSKHLLVVVNASWRSAHVGKASADGTCSKDGRRKWSSCPLQEPLRALNEVDDYMTEELAMGRAGEPRVVVCYRLLC